MINRTIVSPYHGEHVTVQVHIRATNYGLIRIPKTDLSVYFIFQKAKTRPYRLESVRTTLLQLTAYWREDIERIRMQKMIRETYKRYRELEESGLWRVFDGPLASPNRMSSFLPVRRHMIRTKVSTVV